MHIDYVKELLEVIYNVSEEDRKYFLWNVYFGSFKTSIELHVYHDV